MGQSYPSIGSKYPNLKVLNVMANISALDTASSYDIVLRLSAHYVNLQFLL